MCGIAGYNGDFEPDLLDRMNAVVQHRGPDDSGTWHNREAGVGLAHRRLTIIDLSRKAHQPMWDGSGRVVIAFNGEIYNYRELRKDLEAHGHSFLSSSDTEVLLGLYLRYGTDMLERLNGIFAFAIWDTQDRTLFLARDALGVKPLYFTTTARGYIFGSELKSILEAEEVNRDLNLDAVHYYLTYLYSPGAETMLNAVRKLEPGHAMVVRCGRIERHWKYYDLPYREPIEYMTEREAVERVRACVREAVRRQMVADVPVGCFLSGGLDSSSVVKFATEFTSASKLECFTIAFRNGSMQREGMSDDLHYAKQVAKFLGVNLSVVEVGSRDIANDFQFAVAHMEEPQADPAALNTYYISRLAREHGMKVLLSGTGGDDIFTGYRRHVALGSEWMWSWLPTRARRLLRSVTRSIPNGPAWGRRLNKAFRHADLNGDQRIASYFYWIDPEVLKPLYGQRMREHASSLVASKPMVDALRNLPASVPALNRMLYLDGKFFLTDHNLNYTDKMGMAAGVEIRVPLLDVDLVALAARLPIDFKQHGRTGKWIFRRAMESALPREILRRPKTGFAAPIRGWIRDELRAMIEDALSAPMLEKHGLFDARAVQRLVNDDREGKIDGSYTILALLVIEMWQNEFIDRRTNVPAIL